jgi:hypothetical protein
LILEYSRARARKVRCTFCGKVFKRRSARNDPAYCSYQCGSDGQPHAVRIVMRTSAGTTPNNQ